MIVHGHDPRLAAVDCGQPRAMAVVAQGVEFRLEVDFSKPAALGKRGTGKGDVGIRLGVMRMRPATGRLLRRCFLTWCVHQTCLSSV